VAAGCSAGLSAGCRPHYGVVSAVVLAMYAAYVLRAGRFRELLWFGTPVAVCGLGLAWYNFARFDNPLEFGTNYQLTGNSVAHVMLHARHVVPTLYFYFFSQPQWMNQFPFLQLMRPEAAPFGRPDWMPWINLEEEFAGILTIAPLCAAGLVLPLALLRKSADWRAVKLVVFALWGAALIMLTSIAFAGSIAMRYHPDYAPELLVAALFVCLWAVSAAQSRAKRTIAVAATVVGCVWGTGCTMALSVNSYNHSLRTRNPADFRSLVSFFGGDPSAIRYPVRQLKFAATMTIPGGAGRSSREAILSAGSGEAGDVVFVEYTGRNRLRFGVQHAGHREVLGPEIEYTAGAPLDFLLDYERTGYGRLTVRLAGQTVLFRQGEMCFTAPAEIAVGRDKRGSGEMPRFSGQLAINDGVSLGFGE
jgi:hypothetical protein